MKALETATWIYSSTSKGASVGWVSDAVNATSRSFSRSASISFRRATSSLVLPPKFWLKLFHCEPLTMLKDLEPLPTSAHGDRAASGSPIVDRVAA